MNIECSRGRGARMAWRIMAVMLARAGNGTALVLLLAASVAPAAAQNLLVNPGFDTDLTGWVGGGTHDAGEGNPAGSANLSGTVPTGLGPLAVQQCIDGIVPGETYTFGAEFLLEQAADGGTANVELDWYGDPCATSTDFLAFHFASPVSATGVAWQSSDASAEAPMGAMSVIVTAIVGYEAAGPGLLPCCVPLVDGDYTAHVDNLYVVGPPMPVPTLGVWWLIALMFLPALVAVRLLLAGPRAA